MSRIVRVKKVNHSFLDILAAMSFASYEDYLKSALWAQIRSRVYELKGRICCRCKIAKATQIHHTSYDEPTLRGESLNALIPICRDCHEKEHGIKRGIRLARRKVKQSPRKKKVMTYLTHHGDL